MKKSSQEDPRTQDELQHLIGDIFAFFVLASKASVQPADCRRLCRILGPMLKSDM
jgi:hypothetical protein